MTNIEAVFLWTGLWFYGLSFVSFLFGVVFKKDKAITCGSWLAFAGLAMMTISMGARWIETGHPPVMRTYENSMLGSWFIMIIFIAIRRWSRQLEIIGVAVMPLVILMIGKGVMVSPVLQPLSPPFKSNWLWLHVFFAWVAYGAFCVGAVIGLFYLIKDRQEKRGRSSPFLEKIPTLPLMNDLLLKVTIFGFVALTVEVGAGALWAYDLWGRYWGWDPIETWSLITWLTYGTYIHLAATLGWKGARMAWLAILALSFVFITFGGIAYFGGVHTAIL